MIEEDKMSIITDTDIFAKIAGLKISYASIANGVVTLVFDNKWTLGIYNKLTMSSNGVQLDDINISILTNNILISASESDSNFVILLSNNISLTVDLSDKGFFGPEAMQLVGPDNLIMVWN